MDAVVLIVFIVVYLGMIAGEIPGLALDRTGVALLGAIALLVFNRMSPSDAWQAVDVSTIALLLGLMVVSSQFRLAGLYTRITHLIADGDAPPPLLLAMVIAVAGVLSAVLANDIVCLAMAPILIESCARRRLDPVPFLLALACASNIGSAATFIGNPQNMLVGQSLDLSFGGYMLDALVPVVLGLAITWAVIAALYRSRWIREGPIRDVPQPEFDRWQAMKAIIVAAGLMAAFLLTDWPRDVVALGAAGVLLLNRRMASRDMLALVDWQLLILFIGLFIVNHSVKQSGVLELMVQSLRDGGVDPAHPAWLFVIVTALSNLVSNVPAVMLMLPLAEHPMAGPVLALASTLAGNLLIVGSIANIIVVDQAARLGVTITWRAHARVGVPVTLLTLAIAAAWLWWRASVTM